MTRVERKAKCLAQLGGICPIQDKDSPGLYAALRPFLSSPVMVQEALGWEGEKML